MPLGTVIVGGVLFSLIAYTLYVVPAMYSYLSRAKKAHLQENEPVAEELVL
jgi:multidrug efflux pump